MAESRREPDVKPVPPDSPENAPGLHRTLGLGEVTAGGVGIIIGAGIYVLIGAATAHAGEMVWGLVIVIVIGAPHVGDVSLLTGPGLGGVLNGAVLVMLTQLEARAVWMGLAVCADGAIAAFLLRPGNRSAAA
jgi:hypothetical protein